MIMAPSVNDTHPSAPAAASATESKKPKRPLSGYNLFYRYKRIKIVEALARGAGPSSPQEEREINGSVLASPPGLEGLSSDHPVRSLPQDAIDEFRGRTIRAAMEGKLFPNENARKRLHRRSVGMGFVEMGRAMRTLWAGADRVSKEVFCDLADVGRAKYRVLMAEYERREMQTAGQVKSSAATPSEAAATQRSFVVSGANASPSAPRAYSRQVSTDCQGCDVNGQSLPFFGMSSEGPSGDDSLGSLRPLAIKAEPAPRANSRQVSFDRPGDEDVRSGLLRVQRMMLQQQAMIGYLANGSGPMSSCLDGNAPSAENLVDGRGLSSGATTPDAPSPSPMDEDACSSADDGAGAVDPSTQDFLDLIGTIGEAIDEETANGEPADVEDPLCIFGMPVHDVVPPADAVAPPAIFEKASQNADKALGGMGPASFGFFSPRSFSWGPNTATARVA